MLKQVAAIAVASALSLSMAFAESSDREDAPGIPAHDRNVELDLPYWAPGRGVVDYDAIRRRALGVLERQFGAFQNSTDLLAAQSVAYCDGGLSRAAYLDAFATAWRAWAVLDSYQFGPIEQSGAALSVNFWPDKKNFVGRALAEALKQPDAALRDPATFAAGSAAAQGFPAIEMLLFSEAAECPAIIGISAHLNTTADDLYVRWFGANGWADLVRAAGPDNPVYLDASEFTKTLYTALDFGLTRIGDTRIGRPLGTFEKSFPTRAEGWRSGLSNDLIKAQLQGVAEMIRDGFAGDVREPDRAWVLRVVAQVEDRLEGLGAPLSEAVKNPAQRIRVEGLQFKVQYLQSQMAQDIGPNLGVDTGFSAADGD